MQAPDDGRREPAPFRLGEWRVDPELGRIVHDDGTTRGLERKVLDLLLALAEQPGRPLSRQALRHRLWNGGHLARGALKHLVWQLRRDLGDDAKSPRYVETVRGRGYRLLVSAPPVAESAERSRRFGLAVAALVALVVAVALVASLRAPPAGSAVGPGPPSRPLTSLPGNEVSPAPSADGRFVVFAWNGGAAGDDYDLYRVATTGGAPEHLVGGPEDEIEPALSADDRQLAYLRGDADVGGRSLLVRPVDSAGERVVARTTGRFVDVVWRGSDSLLVVERPAPGAPSRIVAIGLDGSIQVVTDPESSRPGDLFPTLAPDGESLAFYRAQRGRAGVVVLRQLETGVERALPVPVGRLAGLAFDRSGSGLVASSDRVPPRGLWWLPVADGEPRWLGLPGAFSTEPSIGASGVLVYQDQRCDSNLWSLALDRPAATSRLVPGLASTRQDMQGAFSPDGERVAFLSNRDGRSQIWIADRPDGPPRPLPTDGGPVHSVDWSPDGARLAYAVRRPDGVSTVYTVRASGGGEQQISDPRSHSTTPRWAHDGTSLYYATWRDDGWRVVRHRLTGDARAVDVGRGVAAQEEPDGGALWILAADGGLVRRQLGVENDSDRGERLPVAASDAESWQTVAGGVVFIRWSRDGQRLLSRWHADRGELESLAVLDRNLPYPPGLSVSSDGTTVLWTRIDAVDSDLVIATEPL